MRSGELAAMAGVTVRTLRHYHHVGVLPEPPRSSAGYRRYDVSHLIRLLGITRLTALGIPLAALPEILDDPGKAGELLDELDREAAEEIDTLTARRNSIAALRHTGTPPDLPLELSAWHAVVSAAPVEDAHQEVPPEMMRYERELLVLLSHLLGADGPSRMSALLDLLSEQAEDLAAFDDVGQQFYALSADATDDEVTMLVRKIAQRISPLADSFTGLSSLGPEATGLVEQLNENKLNRAQQRVLRRVDPLLRRA